MNHIKKSFMSYEFVLFLLLVVFIAAVGLINPAFFSVGTMFDIIRNQTVYILLAFGLLPVVILGGFDFSFVTVASLSTFLAFRVLANLGYEGGIWLLYGLGITIGIAAGLIIGWMIWAFKLDFFNLSLGITSMINGLLVLVAGFWHSGGQLPALVGWNMKWLVTVQSVVGYSGLHVSFILVILTFIGMHIFLRYTTIGRTVYAMGSDKSVAVRTGFNAKKIYMAVFSILGAMAAVAAVTGSGLGFGARSFADKFMKIYATVIIGGASVHGGRGSVFGTLLGVFLVGIINQAFVYVKIPTAWGDAFWGGVFLLFTIYQTLERRLIK
ncbi:MAG: ABC transporter permease [Anaerolineaceae bacterium]|nr:ABC transporter permease [Anaerolineaceae bacterium]